MKKRYSAVVVLSGGLDSYVSLAVAREYFDIELALTFDYGQRAAEDEIEAASNIAKVYNIKHKVIELPFLKEITTCALNDESLNIEFENLGDESANAVWVPNRNGLFLNIAASYCDAYGYQRIIFGANKEEAGTFPDNSSKFRNAADNLFIYSTKVQPEVFTPLIKMEKYEIINTALKLGVDLSLVKSCYNSHEKIEGGDKGRRHCGVCESCRRLKAAILKSDNKDLIKLFF